MRRLLRPGAKRQLQLRSGAGLLRCGAASRSRFTSQMFITRHAQLLCVVAQLTANETSITSLDCAMRSSSAPWRRTQWSSPSNTTLNAPCAVLWRHGADSREIPPILAHKGAMRSPVAPWRSLQGT
ncbi:unnamed protein product [Trifolium pratense]|uniref:Uncharacterized protein n=1 Tax=Trifolium pratense TaxID=57577 RepID=A0ACB0J0U3_TRIPR|nr:unnamed protein product [Trifolium pratense]